MIVSYIYLILLVIAAIIICLISIQKYKRIINPLLAAIIPLCLACLFTVNNNKLTTEELNTGLKWILIGIILFSLSFSIGLPIGIGVNKTIQKRDEIYYSKRTVSILINWLCVLLFVDFLMTFSKVYNIAGSVKAILISSTWVRNQYLHRSGSRFHTIIGLLISMNITVISCLFPKAIQLKCKYIKIKFMYAILMMLINSIVTMSKDSFIVHLIIIVYSFSQFSLNRKVEFEIIKKNAKWVILLFTALLIFIGVQRDYLAYRYNSYLEIVIGTFTGYITIPVISFCLLLKTNQFTYGVLCFRPILNILSYLGIGERYSIIQMDVEGGSNVFSTFGNMYRDFGIRGIIFLSLLFGLLLGVLYDRKTQRFDRVVCNSIIGMIMIFTFYDFKLIQTIYPISILYAWILEKIIRKRLYIYNTLDKERANVIKTGVEYQ